MRLFVFVIALSAGCTETEVYTPSSRDSAEVTQFTANPVPMPNARGALDSSPESDSTSQDMAIETELEPMAVDASASQDQNDLGMGLNDSDTGSDSSTSADEDVGT